MYKPFSSFVSFIKREGKYHCPHPCLDTQSAHPLLCPCSWSLDWHSISSHGKDSDYQPAYGRHYSHSTAKERKTKIRNPKRQGNYYLINNDAMCTTCKDSNIRKRTAQFMQIQSIYLTHCFPYNRVLNARISKNVLLYRKIHMETSNKQPPHITQVH